MTEKRPTQYIEAMTRPERNAYNPDDAVRACWYILQLEAEMAAVIAKPPEGALLITTRVGFFRRLWNLVTNPITYLFAGKIRW